MSSPFLNGVSKSASPFEKRQFFILPSAVRRNRLQSLQKGVVIVVINANVPANPGILYFFEVLWILSSSFSILKFTRIDSNISLYEKSLSRLQAFPSNGINSMKRICTGK